MIGHVEYNGITRRYKALLIDNDGVAHEAEADTAEAAEDAAFVAAVGEKTVTVRNIGAQRR